MTVFLIVNFWMVHADVNGWMPENEVVSILILVGLLQLSVNPCDRDNGTDAELLSPMAEKRIFCETIHVILGRSIRGYFSLLAITKVSQWHQNPLSRRHHTSSLKNKFNDHAWNVR